MPKYSSLALGALLLTGCIFESDSGRSFQISLSGYLVEGEDDMLESRVSSFFVNGSGALRLEPAPTEGVLSQIGAEVDAAWRAILPRKQDNIYLHLTPDSTLLLRFSGTTSEDLVVDTIARYRDFPCKFSSLRAVVRVPREADTEYVYYPVVLKGGVRLEKSGNVEMYLGIDEAASLARSPAVTFSHAQALLAYARATCP